MATTTKPRSTKRASKPAAKKTTALVPKPQPKTLITGGTGFLGSHLVRQLLEAGATNLRVLTTSTPAWLEQSGVEIVEGSITEPSDVSRSVEGVAEIFHLAGKVSREPEDAHSMYKLHVEGTRSLCQAASAAGVSTIVMASTSGTIAVTEDGEALPDENWPQPLDIISRWPYYASKFYQERAALENFSGDGRRLVIVNPSLLLGPGDDRLSSTQVVLDFLGRKIPSVPSGGLSFVDVRDAAAAFRSAMANGRHGERYLLGAVNWTFENFFGRLERLTKVAGPRVSLPSKIAINGSKVVHAFYRHWNLAPPVHPGEVEMAEYFWYLDNSKAQRELGFAPRDPGETLNDTVRYVRDHFLGAKAFSGRF
jgi:dihydroflavonol-4-reductase